MRLIFFLPIVLSCLLSACPRQEPAHPSTCNPGLTACTTPTRFGPVTLQLYPRPVPPMTPFAIEVHAASPLDEVTVTFNGRDMDMGPNTVRLLRDTSGAWRGAATLPICVTGPMTWQAIVVLTQDGHAETLRLDFDTATR